MSGELVELASVVSTPLIWIAMAAFLGAWALDRADYRSLAVPLAGGGWLAFGAFWLVMVPHFWYDVASPLQSFLSLAGVPLAVYAGYLLVGGRDSLLDLTRAIAFMGLIYLPMTTIEPARVWMIETVTIQTHIGMELLGYSPGITEGPNGLQSQFDFDGYTTYIVEACTGIGAISIFGGLIASVSAPLGRRLLAFAIATGVIWILNLARNVFVGLASPLGWFDYPIFHSITDAVVGDGMVTSFFISHNVIAQSLSVVALIGITLVVLKIVPEVVRPLEEVLYVLTGSEYDLQSVLAGPVVTDEPAD